MTYYRVCFIFFARSQFIHVNPLCADIRTRIQERMTYDHRESASPALYLQPRVAICHLSPASGPNNLFDHGCQSCAYFNSYILWRILIKSDAGIFYWNLLIYTYSVYPTNKKRQIPWNQQKGFIPAYLFCTHTYCCDKSSAMMTCNAAQ